MVFVCKKFKIDILVNVVIRDLAELPHILDTFRGVGSWALGATKVVHTTDGDALHDITRLSSGKRVDVAIVANANVALNSIWKSYGQSTLPLQRVLLMPSQRMYC